MDKNNARSDNAANAAIANGQARADELVGQCLPHILLEELIIRIRHACKIHMYP